MQATTGIVIGGKVVVEGSVVAVLSRGSRTDPGGNSLLANCANTTSLLIHTKRE